MQYCVWLTTLGALFILGASQDSIKNEPMSTFLEDWFDVEAYPPAEDLLNERQQLWFHSLGYGDNNTNPGPSEKDDLPWEPGCLRKEYRTLTDEERSRFHNAVNAMKTTTIDDVSEYDIVVLYHRIATAPGAHGGAAFYPWHREYLLR